MDKSTFLLLDYLTEGIILLDEDLKIYFWNKHMEILTGKSTDETWGKSVFDIFPKIKNAYFTNVFATTFKTGNQYFFSSKIHRHLISERLHINFKSNRLVQNGKKYILLEFTDVTNEYVRVNQLKTYVDELTRLNKDLQEKKKEIAKLVYKDNLTNLSNRALFYSVTEKLLASAKRNNNFLGFMFIDIDNFKTINDNYGHLTGDKILIETANVLTKSTRESDMVFRFGGDEFIILLPDLSDKEGYKKVVGRIQKTIKELIFDGGIGEVSLSIGMSMYPCDGQDIEDLILKADQAMYRAKKTGGGKCIYKED